MENLIEEILKDPEKLKGALEQSVRIAINQLNNENCYNRGQLLDILHNAGVPYTFDGTKYYSIIGLNEEEQNG